MAARLLDRLQPANAPGLPQGLYTWAQRVCEQVEALFEGQQQQITDLAQVVADQAAQLALIVAAQAAADAAAADAAAADAAAAAAQSTANTANTTATTANTTANTANATATAVKKTDKISSSWTSPGSILSASDAGSNATISVAAHTRYYGDNSSVSVSSGSVTGLSYSTTYYVYYTDTATTGGSKTFLASTDPNVASYNRADGRHFCGKITTPAGGSPPTSGGTLPPGGGFSGPGEIP